MAGGEGAKERRRLKRLASQEAKNKPEKSSQRTEAEKPNFRKVRDNRYNKRASNSSGAKWSKKMSNTDNRKKEKKPKFKKPKHLKRKLEQASNENEEAKDVAKREIEQFEATKTLYSKTKAKTNNKRQKSTDFDPLGSGSGSGDDNQALSRVNKINHNKTPFPRNEKSEIEKSAMIEDDNVEMTDRKETTEGTVLTAKDVLITANAEPEEDLIHGSSDDESLTDDTGGTPTSEVVENEKKGENVDVSGETSGENSPSAVYSSSKSDDNSVDDSDDDTDDDEPIQQRQRGRGRRGRQDTAKKIEEMEAAEKSKVSTESDGKSEKELKDGSTKTGKKRYCLGRKPVTDFVIGQICSAKVVYVKAFGVFFDVGCHSDAFCHVSRLSDDFIESPESKFKEGDDVPNVRIVEIDRRQKRITVSLQSEARIEDELKSIEARKTRKEKIKNKSKKKPSSHSSGNNNYRSENYNLKGTSVSNEFAVNRPNPSPAKKNLDPSMTTPADLKRARKLARRAERRAQAEQQE